MLSRDPSTKTTVIAAARLVFGRRIMTTDEGYVDRPNRTGIRCAGEATNAVASVRVGSAL